MDSVATITIALPPRNCKSICSDAFALMLSFEDEISATKKESAISQLNAGNLAELTPETAALIGKAIHMRELTNGLYEPNILTLKRIWEDCEVRGTLPSPEEIAAISYPEFSLTNDENGYRFSEPVKLDMGGIGKGFACDMAAERLRECGITSAVVDMISSVTAIGSKPDGSPWSVGIKDPRDTSKLIGTVILSDASLSVSGGYERYYEIGGTKYQHILDPRTGYPSDNGVLSAIVVSGDAVLADALSTALCVMDTEAISQLYGSGQLDFEYILITEKETICSTKIKDIYKSY